ncbi:MAG: hypothetical protein HY927_16205 [Elusimicrobia bacterium]|nr:hypothetical protein [Elusimicrobiota bacterium]
MNLPLLAAVCLAWSAGPSWAGPAPRTATADAKPPVQADPGAEPSAGAALGYLEGMFDPGVGLLRQLKGSNDYWLFQDNYLAARVLAADRPKLAEKIRTALARHPAAGGGRIEIVFDEIDKPMIFRESELVTVSKIGEKRVRTERLTDRKVDRWEENADLLFLAAIARRKTAPATALAHYRKAVMMWDGQGFLDKESFHTQLYSTRKLGLALLAARKLGEKLPQRRQIIGRLALQQDSSGGFVADYDRDGRPVGVPTVETTCLVLLGLRGGR